MKFLQRLSLADGPLKILFGLFTGLGITLLLYAFLSGRRGENLAPTLLPTLTPKPAATLTLVVPTSTPFTDALPTYLPLAPPEPSPTRFYIIPSDATAIPTPFLPAAAPFPTSCDGPGRMNILLIGLDGFSGNYQRAARSDSIIIVGVNFSAKNAQMLSIPRDLWVQLPNLPQVPQARINTAYHYGELYQVPGGGPAQLSATIANTFGLRIDRFVVVNFLAFEQGVDAIGGIDVDIPRPVHDGAYPLRDGSGTIVIDFPAGRIHLDGSNALIYARIRHDNSDFQRMRRQQQVLFAIRDKLLSPEAIPQLPALAQVLATAVRTDLSVEDTALLGCLGPQISRESIQTWVIDSSLTQPSRLPDGGSVLLPKMEAILPILGNFNTGE
jgi:polyisoprenyl-teichoic acid--peptidoglycan teichoic acid transferase